MKRFQLWDGKGSPKFDTINKIIIIIMMMTTMTTTMKMMIINILALPLSTDKHLMMAVSRSYIWAYASFQFAIVILFAHIFYTIVRKSVSVLWLFSPVFHNSPLLERRAYLGSSSHVLKILQLNVNPILSVLLSSFTGFGIAISTNTLLVEYLRWRTNRQLQFTRQQIEIALQQQQQIHHQQQQQHQEQYQHHHLQPLSENLQQQEQQFENPNPGPTHSSRQQVILTT